MKLIVQPDAGMAPVVTAIKQAKKSIDVLIFRLDRLEIARALEAAVARGVAGARPDRAYQSRRREDSSQARDAPARVRRDRVAHGDDLIAITAR
jgi:phosphatidylserine/phosphatidylglycerophosphate/cardiolipin synthase-like enzyme